MAPAFGPHREGDVHDGAGRAPMPVRSLEEVDEVDPEGVFGLAHLPILTSTVAFQLLAELAYLVARGSSEAARVRNLRTQRTQNGAAFSLTSRVFRMNSPNCCRDASNSRMIHLRSEEGQRACRLFIGARSCGAGTGLSSRPAAIRQCQPHATWPGGNCRRQQDRQLTANLSTGFAGYGAAANPRREDGWNRAILCLHGS
jgi:hypothetical protein